MMGELDPGDEWRIRPIAEALRRGPRGQLWFGAGSDRPADWARRLGELVGPERSVVRVELRPDDNPWERLSGARQSEDVVVGWFGRGPVPDSAFWQRLNLGRERRRRDSWSLVLWFPDWDWLEVVSRAAPDLWSHRSGVLHAVSPPDPSRLTVRGAWYETLEAEVERARRLGTAEVADRRRLEQAIRGITLFGDAPEHAVGWLRTLEYSRRGAVSAFDQEAVAARLAGQHGVWELLKTLAKDGHRGRQDVGRALLAAGGEQAVAEVVWSGALLPGGWPVPLFEPPSVSFGLRGPSFTSAEARASAHALAGLDTLTCAVRLGSAAIGFAERGARGGVEVALRCLDELRETIGLRRLPWSPSTPKVVRDAADHALVSARSLLGTDPGGALEALAAVSGLPNGVELFPEVDVASFDFVDADPIEAGLALLRTPPPPNVAPHPGLPRVHVDPVGDLRAEAWRVEARALASLGRHDEAVERVEEARRWYAANTWDLGVRTDADLDLVELLLARPETVARARKLLDSIAVDPGAGDLEPLVRSGRAERLRARAFVATGRPQDALVVLQRALDGPSCAAVRLAVDLDIAALPPPCPWEVRAESARRARDAAAAALLVIAEGRALACWAWLLDEVGRHEEAGAARSDARWIADRCPDPELLAALGQS